MLEPSLRCFLNLTRTELALLSWAAGALDKLQRELLSGSADTERQTDRQTDRTGQDRTGQDRTGQDRTGQDRTGQTDRQDRTGQDRTGQDRTDRQTDRTDRQTDKKQKNKMTQEQIGREKGT